MCDRTPLEKHREIENNATLKLIARRLGQIIELLTPADRQDDQERSDEEEAGQQCQLPNESSSFVG